MNEMRTLASNVLNLLALTVVRCLSKSSCLGRMLDSAVYYAILQLLKMRQAKMRGFQEGRFKT